MQRGKHDPNCSRCPDCSPEAARILALGPAYIPPRRAAATRTMTMRATCSRSTDAPDGWNMPELRAALSSPSARAASAPLTSERSAAPAPDAWGLRSALQPVQGTNYVPRPPLVPLEPHFYNDPAEPNGSRRAAAATKAPNAWGLSFENGVSQIRDAR